MGCVGCSFWGTLACLGGPENPLVVVWRMGERLVWGEQSGDDGVACVCVGDRISVVGSGWECSVPSSDDVVHDLGFACSHADVYDALYWMSVRRCQEGVW